MENVHLNRKNYRVLLQAMSRPGRVFCLVREERRAPLFPFLAIGECLLDQEVSFYVEGEEALATAIVTATGSKPASLPEADFVFTFRVTGRGPILQAKRGSPESPERGATLVCSVSDDCADSPDHFRVRLTGPGIPGKEGLVPEMSGIALDDLRALQDANADYPMGVDAVFARKDGRVMCIPRSCRIQWR